MNKDVIKFCGEYPNGFVPVNISNSPDYVFKPDSSFNVVKLHDIEGNTVFVNSFVECEHYVMGGWNYNLSNINNFSYSEFSILLIFVISLHFLLNKTQILKKYFK